MLHALNALITVDRLAFNTFPVAHLSVKLEK